MRYVRACWDTYMDIISFVLALVPILWLVVDAALFKWPSVEGGDRLVRHRLRACRDLRWGMPVDQVATASLEGFLMALWPIVLVIIAAVFTYNLCVSTGAMDVIGQMITSISSDRRISRFLSPGASAASWRAWRASVPPSPSRRACSRRLGLRAHPLGPHVPDRQRRAHALRVDRHPDRLACRASWGLTPRASLPSRCSSSRPSSSRRPSSSSSWRAGRRVRCRAALERRPAFGDRGGCRGPSLWPRARRSWRPPYVVATFVGPELSVVVGSICSLGVTALLAMRAERSGGLDERFRMRVVARSRRSTCAGPSRRGPASSSSSCCCWGLRSCVPAVNAALAGFSTTVPGVQRARSRDAHVSRGSTRRACGSSSRRSSGGLSRAPSCRMMGRGPAAIRVKQMMPTVVDHALGARLREGHGLFGHDLVHLGVLHRGRRRASIPLVAPVDRHGRRLRHGLGHQLGHAVRAGSEAGAPTRSAPIPTGWSR